MTEIDWSKAPESATHADPHGDAFYRADFEGMYVWLPDTAMWLLDTRTSLNSLVPRPDPVNHPEHYTAGGIECIDAIAAALTPEEFRGYCKGNALKYVWRERHKGGDESLRKARWYLTKLTNNED